MRVFGKPGLFQRGIGVNQDGITFFTGFGGYVVFAAAALANFKAKAKSAGHDLECVGILGGTFTFSAEMFVDFVVLVGVAPKIIFK